MARRTLALAATPLCGWLVGCTAISGGAEVGIKYEDGKVYVYHTTKTAIDVAVWAKANKGEAEKTEVQAE